ncbi:AraC-type DNA-binding protein [Sanguibacter gelidistatuariae]|uniref:AraC-type DNA-binding protein n=1 Tax=Sanguibacter gelidistatuariae TaxID=1814289 RepID=A0A1G6GMH6_9MICO|nr:AraC family transcriptional regulator [Sanguibacter gelidistatuariae]SDB83212.1 AraC-type DNA-binding protein [Sanguibacter gelidistatuariae]
MWEPIPSWAVKQILRDYGGEPHPDRVAEIGRHLWVPSGRPFHYSDHKRTVGEVSLMETDQSAFRSTTGRDVSEDGILSIGVVTSGQTQMGRSGRTAEVVPTGGAYVLRSWTEWTVEMSDETRGTVVRIPEHRLRERGIRVHPDRVRLDGAPSLAGPLSSFVSSVVRPSWQSTAVGEDVVERAVEDLVVGMLLETSGYAMDSEELRTGLCARAAGVISREHRSGDLTPAMVATLLGVSLRHLQRAHEQNGVTIAAVIAAERTRSAALLLVAPGAMTLTLSEIARRCGFGSTFELRNQFRSAYGVLPSQYRADAALASEGRALTS